ncbi:transcription factor gsfR2 [Parachaetomium inaequale]|uniref:Transcription factor gsfR2 n=1 Tax=Parachaetomium inaequale TaxID=2588326 RepID=A0AAN6PAC1_9PEZI|nr:transcription factor gsfR2 [Parachaetomium inaequale]
MPPANSRRRASPPLPYFVDVLPAADPVGLAGHGASAFQDFLDGLHARAGSNSTTGNSSVGIPVVSDYADNPWPIFFDASGPANTSITRASMAYCVKEYRAWPRRWVAEASTPFIHPALYAGSAATRTVPRSEVATALGLGSNSLTGLPPVLQDAFAVSAAYAAKNAANSDLVMQLVESKATALLYSPDQGNWTIMEQLAALQALLVYQMVRLFDGDIRQRALAETVEPVQAAWTAALQARVGGEIFQGVDLQQAAMLDPLASAQFASGAGNHSAHAVTVNDDPATAWQRWLFNETARRTIITSFMIQGIYAMAKQGYCRLGPVVTDMSFTSGSRLWAAKTPGRWRRAVGETDPGWVNRMDFVDMLGRADPRNLDEFGVMMAVTYRGKDVIEDWMDREL